jgi:hypothetical protein
MRICVLDSLWQEKIKRFARDRQENGNKEDQTKQDIMILT